MVTIHMVANAHIDPVWLWRWPAGVVTLLSTCRAAADLLDTYPEVRFTRSDQWVYEQVESVDPALFGRVCRLVREGRWVVAGGWYIQPDCNLPHVESFRRQMRMGKTYFRDRLGVDVTVGYNVDSFGHHAMLPALLREAGFDSYVMMRPQPHEKALPSSLFRWRSPDGSEVLTWRIVSSYNHPSVDGLAAHASAALAAAHPSVPHVMCFFGVGDHGGGPTRAQVEWIRDHPDALPGARMVFSDPRTFFDAVLPHRESLEVVQDELQYHAIGCYSAVRAIKTGVRRAEHALMRAQRCVDLHPELAPAGAAGILDVAWKEVLFNQFHDILAGSSIEGAYRDAADQLGLSTAAAESITHGTLLRSLGGLGPDRRQRVAVWNLSGDVADGPVTHDPWLEARTFRGRLVDAEGTEIPYQVAQQPALLGEKRLLVWLDRMGASSRRVLYLEPDTPPTPIPTDLAAEGDGIRGELTAARKSGAADGLVELALAEGPRYEMGVVVQEDPSDTWSHGIDGFRGDVAGHFRVLRCVVEETGPIRATLRLDASFGSSRLVARARLYRARPYVELEMELEWMEKRRIAKLVVGVPRAATRRDGIPGGSLERPTDGREYPLVDWTLSPDGWGIVAPDCFALDARDGELRFTLVRSPVYAWHEPTVLDPGGRYRHTDQGEHAFRFRWIPRATPRNLEAAALSFHNPPVCLDWTEGMQA